MHFIVASCDLWYRLCTARCSRFAFSPAPGQWVQDEGAQDDNAVHELSKRSVSSNQCRYSTNDAYHYERICHARNDIEILLERQR